MEMSFPRDKNSPDPPHSQRQRRVNPENEENSENLADLIQIEPMYKLNCKKTFPRHYQTARIF